MNRNHWAWVLSVGLITACQPGTSGDKNKPLEVAECAVSYECPGGQTCNAGQCIDYQGCQPGQCGPGQICNGGTCQSVTTLCDTPSAECFCRLGNSVGQFEPNAQPAKIVLPAGADQELRIMVTTQAGVSVSGLGVDWQTTGGFEVDVNADGQAMLLAPPTPESEGKVIASIRGLDTVSVLCEAHVRTLSTAPFGKRRIRLVDDITGASVEQGKVVVRWNNQFYDATLQADGDFILDIPAMSDTDTFDITVFAANHNIVSMVGVSASLQDIVLPLRAVPNRRGGVSGEVDFDTFANEMGADPTEQALRFAFVANSLSLQTILNFDFQTIIGDTVKSDIASLLETLELKLEMDQKVDLPRGLILRWKQSDSTDAQEHPFHYFDAPGTRGMGWAWALGGEIPSSSLASLFLPFAPMILNPDIPEGELPPLDLKRIAEAFMPLMPLFGAGWMGNVPIAEVSQEVWDNFVDQPLTQRQSSESLPFKLLDGAGDPWHQSRLALQNRMSNFTRFNVDALPEDINGRAMEAQMLLTGLYAKGQGFVPLGLGIGLDCDEKLSILADPAKRDKYCDGRINQLRVCRKNLKGCSGNVKQLTDNGTIPANNIGMFHAPAPIGWEGVAQSKQLTLSVALPLSSFIVDRENLMDGDGIRVTGLLMHGTDNIQTGKSNVLGGAKYPEIPVASRRAARTLEVSRRGHAVQWITMAHSDEKMTWNVYFLDADKAEQQFVAPSVPAELNVADFFIHASSEDENAANVILTHVGMQLKSGISAQGMIDANHPKHLEDYIADVTGFAVQSRNLPVLTP